MGCPLLLLTFRVVFCESALWFSGDALWGPPFLDGDPQCPRAQSPRRALRSGARTRVGVGWCRARARLREQASIHDRGRNARGTHFTIGSGGPRPCGSYALARCHVPYEDWRPSPVSVSAVFRSADVVPGLPRPSKILQGLPQSPNDSQGFTRVETGTKRLCEDSLGGSSAFLGLPRPSEAFCGHFLQGPLTHFTAFQGLPRFWKALRGVPRRS